MKTNQKEIQEFCNQIEITEDQFYGKEEIQRYLGLDHLREIPENFNPTVGGSLWLNGLKEIPENFNPIVGGGLSLNGLKEIPENFSPAVGGGLSLNGLKEIPENFNPTVGGSLYLDGLKEIPESFNPTVGGYLCLNGLKEIPESFNPTVGGSLRFNGLKEIPEGFRPTVGGSLWISNKTRNDLKKPTPHILSWKNGKYVSIDGIFGEVLSKKKVDNIEIRKLKKIVSNEIFFVVTENKISSHGKTISQALRDLRFKQSDRNLSDYEDLTLDLKLSLEESVICYRVITGACSFGVEDFIENNSIPEDKEFSIQEITY